MGKGEHSCSEYLRNHECTNSREYPCCAYSARIRRRDKENKFPFVNGWFTSHTLAVWSFASNCVFAICCMLLMYCCHGIVKRMSAFAVDLLVAYNGPVGSFQSITFVQIFRGSYTYQPQIPQVKPQSQIAQSKASYVSNVVSNVARM